MKASPWIRIAQVLLIGAIAWGVWRSLGPALRDLRASDFFAWRPAPGPLLLSCLILLATYLSHAFLWRRVMTDLGIGRPDARTTVRIHFVAGLGRYLPGKLWQLAGLAVLAREAGIPAAPAAAAAVIGSFAFLATGLLLLAAMLPGWAGGWPALLGAGLLVVAGAAFWVLVATPLGHGARERLRALGGARFSDRITTVFDLADRVRPRHALLWLAAYGFTWILFGMAFTFFCAAFVPAAADAPRLVAGSLAASYLAGYVALVPVGIGVREGALASLLASTDTVPPAAAVVIALASRVWFTLFELVPIALLPLFGTSRGEVRP